MKAALKAVSFAQEPHIVVKIWLRPRGATERKAVSIAGGDQLTESSVELVDSPHMSFHSPGGKTPREGRAIARVANRSLLASLIKSG
jgi:hypothetical protein